MIKRRRTDNTMFKRRRTDNTMFKRRRIQCSKEGGQTTQCSKEKVPTMIFKTLHRKERTTRTSLETESELMY
jgi:hypothetical protein